MGSSRATASSAAPTARRWRACGPARSTPEVPSGEPGHDLLAEDPHVVVLGLHVGRAETHPQLPRPRLGDLLDPLDPVARVAGQREAIEGVAGQTELLHPAGVPALGQDVVVELVAVDVLLDLRADLVGYMLAVEPEPHGMIQDRRYRGLDVLDGAVPIVVQRRARREPDVDVVRVASGLARAGLDARDRVLDDRREQTCPGGHAVADPAAQVEHLRTLGADRDGNA